MSVRYKIGDQVTLKDFPISKVVGIDWYRMRTVSGEEKKWPSYTLVSDQEGKFSRWWITDEKDGLYYWNPVSKDEIDGTIDHNDSGLCTLDAEGDSIVSSPFSSVLVFKKNDAIFCMEAFSEEVLYMKGVKVHEV